MSASQLMQSNQDQSGLVQQWTNAWNGFWFTKRDTTTLGLVRIVTGLIVFYTHLVWTMGLDSFLGSDGMLPPEYRSQLYGTSYAWSHLDWFGGGLLNVVHFAGLVVMLMFTIGLWTRWTSVITTLLVISYCNRVTGAQFGLDQINTFLCLYLVVGNSGGSFSVDAWRSKSSGRAGQGGCDVFTNIAIRLIQVHMCIVYFFAGVGKLQGETWLTGEAIWLSLASYEYQTLDMTWMADHLWLVSLITLVTLAWEVSYAALIWPKLTRPIMLAITIPVHLGIGLCMGMMTFGLIMLAGNLAFLDVEKLGWFSTGGDKTSRKQ